MEAKATAMACPRVATALHHHSRPQTPPVQRPAEGTDSTLSAEGGAGAEEIVSSQPMVADSSVI